MSKLDHTVQKRKIAGNALICFFGGVEGGREKKIPKNNSCYCMNYLFR